MSINFPKRVKGDIALWGEVSKRKAVKTAFFWAESVQRSDFSQQTSFSECSGSFTMEFSFSQYTIRSRTAEVFKAVLDLSALPRSVASQLTSFS